MKNYVNWSVHRHYTREESSMRVYSTLFVRSNMIDNYINSRPCLYLHPTLLGDPPWDLLVRAPGGSSSEYSYVLHDERT